LAAGGFGGKVGGGKKTLGIFLGGIFELEMEGLKGKLLITGRVLGFFFLTGGNLIGG